MIFCTRAFITMRRRFFVGSPTAIVASTSMAFSMLFAFVFALFAAANGTTACGAAATRGILAWQDDAGSGSADESGAYYGSFAANGGATLTDANMRPFRTVASATITKTRRPRIDVARSRATFLEIPRAGETNAVACLLPRTDADTTLLLNGTPASDGRCRIVRLVDAMGHYAAGPAGDHALYGPRLYNAGCGCAASVVDVCCGGGVLSYSSVLAEWNDTYAGTSIAANGTGIDSPAELRVKNSSPPNAAFDLHWSPDGSRLLAWINVAAWTFDWDDASGSASNAVPIDTWTADEAQGIGPQGPGWGTPVLDWTFTSDGRFFLILTACEIRYVRVDEPGHQFSALLSSAESDGCSLTKYPRYYALSACDDDLLYVADTASRWGANNRLLELRLNRSNASALTVTTTRVVWSSMHAIERLLVYALDEDGTGAASTPSSTSKPTSNPTPTSSANSCAKTNVPDRVSVVIVCLSIWAMLILANLMVDDFDARARNRADERHRACYLLGGKPITWRIVQPRSTSRTDATGSTQPTHQN